MKKIINKKKLFGNFRLGLCSTWGRQVLLSKNAKDDTHTDGSFFHSMACHQLGQLINILGLPISVFCKSGLEGDKKIGYKNIPRTASGTAIFDYGKGRYFTYLGNRSANGNPKVLQQDGVVNGYLMVHCLILRDQEEELLFFLMVKLKKIVIYRI